MKIIRIPENKYLNKVLIAEGDEHAIDLFRKEVASRGGNVNGSLSLGIREAGFLIVYDPAPSMGMPGVFRFNFRGMTDKDVVFQNRLKRLRKARGGTKIRRWDHERNEMVTEEQNNAIYPDKPKNDPITGLPLLG